MTWKSRHCIIGAALVIFGLGGCMTFGPDQSAELDDSYRESTVAEPDQPTEPAADEEDNEGPVADPVAEAPERKVLAIDREKSAIGFTGARSKMAHTRYFRHMEGKMTFEGRRPSDIVVQVDMKSLIGEKDLLNWHLESPDFFDVAKYPTSDFQSTLIEPTGEDRYDVTGHLTIKGVKREVTFPAMFTFDDDNVTGEAQMTINRKDFEVAFPGLPSDTIVDDVVLHLTIVCPRQALDQDI